MFQESTKYSVNVVTATPAPPALVLHQARSNIGKRGGLQRRKAPERKEWHVGNAITSQSINHCVISTVGNVVFVLHADDFGNLSRLCNLRRCDVTQANMFYQALLLHLRQHCQAGLNRSFRRAMTIPIITRRLTTSSTSRPRLRRLSCTAFAALPEKMRVTRKRPLHAAHQF